MIWRYRLHGLTLASELELPEVAASPAPEVGAPDVMLELGETPAALAPCLDDGPLWMAGPEQFLLDVPGSGRFLARQGRHILAQPDPEAPRPDLHRHLLGPVWSALLHQRGCLVLRGGAVEAQGQAMAFVGENGAGKSTLAAHLRRRGFRLVCDDLLTLTLDAAGRPWVQPGPPRILLWRDALTALHIKPEAGMRGHASLEKFYLVATTDYQDRPLPLGRLHILAENREDDAISLSPLRGLDGVQTLARLAWKSRHVVAMGLAAQQFQLCSRVAAGCLIHRLRRPKEMKRMQEILDLLENAWTP